MFEPLVLGKIVDRFLSALAHQVLYGGYGIPAPLSKYSHRDSVIGVSVNHSQIFFYHVSLVSSRRYSICYCWLLRIIVAVRWPMSPLGPEFCFEKHEQSLLSLAYPLRYMHTP